MNAIINTGLARSFIVVTAEFTVAPEASVPQIAAEVQTLFDHLAHSPGSDGYGRRPVCLCAHSADGHLAASNRNHLSVSLTVAVSRLFDLEPISLSRVSANASVSTARRIGS